MLSVLEKKIGIKFKSRLLLEQVFIHRSYINENRDKGLENNERLEFLGDAVLELVVTEFLYKNYKLPEGELTGYRSALVKRNNLAEAASGLGLGKYLRLSRGEEKSGGRNKDYILANTLEALIGAVYLEKGFKGSKPFIKKFVIVKLHEILNKGLHIDSKSEFQEKSQEKIGVTPVYQLMKEEGPDHDKVFTMGVYLNKDLIASGKGGNKQSAEQMAAKKAMKKKGW